MNLINCNIEDKRVPYAFSSFSKIHYVGSTARAGRFRDDGVMSFIRGWKIKQSGDNNCCMDTGLIDCPEVIFYSIPAAKWPVHNQQLCLEGVSLQRGTRHGTAPYCMDNIETNYSPPAFLPVLYRNLNKWCFITIRLLTL